MTLATTAAAFYEAGAAFYHLAHKWQDLVAGLLGAGAAIWVVRFTLMSEQRRRDADAAAAMRLLAFEVRELAVRAVVVNILIVDRLGGRYRIADFERETVIRSPAVFQGLLANPTLLTGSTPMVIALYGALEEAANERNSAIKATGDGDVHISRSVKMGQRFLALARLGMALLENLDPPGTHSTLRETIDDRSRIWNELEYSAGFKV